MRTMLISLFHVVRLTGRKVTKFIPNFAAPTLHFFHTHRVLTNGTRVPLEQSSFLSTVPTA